MTILYNEHRRVLLIDENSRRLNVLATILRNREVEVHPAAGLDDARSLWKSIAYDLVLLAAPENSEAAMFASVQIRKVRPRQRIALLVGPPAYIREIGRNRQHPQTHLPEPSAIAGPGKTQWPEIVQKVVTDWYADQSARFALDKMPVASGGPPFLSN